MLMSEAIEQYVRYKEGLGEKPRVKKYVLLSFGKYVGLSMQLDCVAERYCSEYLHQKGFKSNVATQYWFCIYSILEGFFNWAISRGHMSHMPLPTSKPCKPKDFRPYIYTNAELESLFKTALNYRKRCNIMHPYVIQTMLKVTYCLGLRPSETVSLQVIDIDFEAKTVLIEETKFYKSRLLPFGIEVESVLRNYMQWRNKVAKEQGLTSDCLFFDKRNNQVKLSALQAAFRLICKAADVSRNDKERSDVRLQDLRHTFATNRIIQWYKEGKDVQLLLPVLSTYLGHCNIDSTATYISFTPELQKEASLKFQKYAES